MPLHGSNGMPCDYSGGVRIIRDKIPTGIIQELHEYSDTIPSSKHVFDESKAGVQAAEEILAAHYEKTCSWLSDHTILTKTAASKVGEFLCPPPVFFFEKGDICIDLWWGGLEGHHTVCRALPTYTQLIARRQRVPSISTDAPGPLATRPLTYEEIHRQEMKQFDEEIQTSKDEEAAGSFCLLLLSHDFSSKQRRSSRA